MLSACMSALGAVNSAFSFSSLSAALVRGARDRAAPSTSTLSGAVVSSKAAAPSVATTVALQASIGRTATVAARLALAASDAERAEFVLHALDTAGSGMRAAQCTHSALHAARRCTLPSRLPSLSPADASPTDDRSLSARCVSELGRLTDVLRIAPDALDRMLSVLGVVTAHEDVRSAAALAVGGIAVGASSEALTALLAATATAIPDVTSAPAAASAAASATAAAGAPPALARSESSATSASTERAHLLLSALAHATAWAAEQGSPLFVSSARSIVDQCSAFATVKDEALRGLVAQCLGHLAGVDALVAVPTLLQMAGTLPSAFFVRSVCITNA
ncbi:MAG: hypothetical protein EOO41_02550 [Methanobacteriota archaeon]|nr:MAG: hypothetical protein EOO41_02550 [Euryarchaeota archaeon]